MSKLVDNLRRVFKTNSTPIGFRAALSPRSAPALLLGYLPEVNEEIMDSIGNSSFDGIIIDAGANGINSQLLSKLGESCGSIPWGLLWTGSKFADGESLVRAGVDFIVVNTTTSPATTLLEKKIGHILAIEHDIPDSLVRAIDSLGVDAVLLYNGLDDASILNINHLLICQRISGFLRKPLIANISPKLKSDELQALAGVGIKGFVVRITDKETLTKATDLKNILGAISAPKSDSGGVTIPRLNPEKPHSDEDDE